MEIWLPDLPDIQLVQNFHRIPWNTTYWKNWPTAENAYVNGASLAPDLSDRAVEFATGMMHRGQSWSERMHAIYIIQAIRCLPADRLAGGDAQFLSAEAVRPGPGAHEVAGARRSLGGYVHAGIEDMVREYDAKFGLDQPLWRQYVSYLGDTARLDFNYSISNYPRTGRDLIAEALPWTVGLLGTDHAAFVRYRHVSGRAAGLAARAALDALLHAAVMGAARDPVLSAGPDPDVSAGVPVAIAADLRRIFAGRRRRRCHGTFILDVLRACDACRRCRSFWSRPAAGRWACAA